jgi:hypothetical protein
MCAIAAFNDLITNFPRPGSFGFEASPLESSLEGGGDE